MLIKNPKILVVDDEYGLRDGIKRILEPEGFAVETAENGREGIEKGTGFEFDVYLLDLKMPDIDGIDVLARIRKKYPEAICVIMTGHGSIDSAVEATKSGAYAYLTKPFMPDDLMVNLTRAVERRWYILEANRLKEEQNRRLLEIAYEQTRLKTIIHTIADGILIINEDRELVLYNRPVATLLEIKKPFMIGNAVLPLLPEELQEMIVEVMKDTAGVKSLQQELIITPPAEKVMMSNTTPIKNEQDKTIGVVVVIRDITKLKKVELIKNQFVNMVAHELKAPIAAIIGYLDIVTNKTLGDNDEQYQKYLNRSMNRAGALRDLVNDLLNISRMETGTVRKEIITVDLKAIAEEILEFFENEIKLQQLHVQSNLEKNCLVAADQEEIRRIFTNLISNAIKYNRPEGLLDIQVQKSGNHAQIKISDTGIGMKPEETERLFQEFFRAKNKFTRNIAGTGLGLSIIKRIIESYSGEITVDSEFDKGTTFTVTLPLLENI